jgi:hypothetical protein
MATIMGLINQIVSEEIVLPAIQRDFVWTEAQTATLLDSVMRGYPIGIALLWETYNDIQYRHFERDFRVGTQHSYRENTERRRLKVVLDGQQRLQSLFIALRGQRDGRSTFFDVLSGQRWDDAEQGRYLFMFLTADEARARNDETAGQERDPEYIPFWWISVRELFAMPARARRDLAKDLVQTLALTEEEELLLEDNLAAFDEAFTRNENILKLSTIDANLPDDSPYRKSETDVLEIFVRINREGTALSRSDLIFSMLKLNWKESAEGLPEFVSAINDGNSFDLDTDFVVRCLFAVCGLGGKLDIDVLRKQANIKKLQENYHQCCEAIRATVDFVQTECWCQSSRLLGSSTTLVPIVHYLFNAPRHEVPNSAVDRLRKAVYLFALARPFSRYGESRVGNFVRSASFLYDGGDYSFPVELAIRRVRDWERIDSLEELAESNHLLTLHLIQGLSGARVQYSRNTPEIDHIFPRSELRKLEYDESDINDLANFWILAQGKNRNKSNRRPSDYFADVSDAALKRALIDRDLLEYRDFRTFVGQRRGRILARLETRLGLTDADLREA